MGRSASLAGLGSAVALVALAAPVLAQVAPGYLVSPEWVEANLANPAVVVLHVDGRRGAYEEGHLPGARFLDLNAIAWAGEPEVGTEMRTPAEIEAALEAAGVRDGQRVVVYGANPLAAARAWMTLDVMGWGERASFLDGGLGAWRADGRAVTTEEPTFTPGSVTLSPRSGVMVDADWIHARLEDPSVTLLDARPDDEYTGADGGMGGRVHAGHIPGAYQLYWEKLVESRTVHRAHPREELEALFSASGAAAGSTLVVYCMVGLRASYAYLVARMLGYDAKFYDGSWHDWGSRDLPYVSGPSRR
ncbi:MAG: sulfurtransferase [Gemmatimonadota bacterium]